ncbi:MAG: DUF2797 domain-containing protein [Methylococcales bacterium]|nr:DUF2797 domain-containing protein [Methylococcales bacterium]
MTDTFTGHLHKMQATTKQPIEYWLTLDDQPLHVNAWLGKPLTLTYQGQIHCLHCGKQTRKSFNQGYCYPCFIRLAQCDLCIVKPEQCHYAQGTCREPDWAQQFCFQPHIVYLANASGIKVGITRSSQIPQRWIDQGAIQALPILQARSRYLSGLAEICIAQHVSDKTSWQKMLKNQTEPMDLLAWRDDLLSLCAEPLAAIRAQHGDDALVEVNHAQAIDLSYPVLTYPEKVKSFNLDKTAIVSGLLQGIKGQYWLFDTGVINIRKFAGYQVSLHIDH